MELKARGAQRSLQAQRRCDVMTIPQVLSSKPNPARSRVGKYRGFNDLIITTYTILGVY